MAYTEDEILGAIREWKSGRTASAGPQQGLMPWEILARLEGVSATASGVEPSDLNDLMVRAETEVVPHLRALSQGKSISYASGAVW